MMYKQCKNPVTNEIANSAIRLEDNACFPFWSGNTDYEKFKKEINEGTAQLQDAEGNVMTEQDAKDFVKELP